MLHDGVGLGGRGERMSNFKLYTLLFTLIGAGFFSGYWVGQISHLLGGWTRGTLSCFAVIVACVAVGGSMLFGAFAFTHEIEKAQIVKHEDGAPFTVTLVLGPWKWTREIPTEVIEP